MANPIVHFEIPAADPARLIGFYQKIFDWKIEEMPGSSDYWTIQTHEGDGPGISGGLLKRVTPTQTAINYVQVDSVDQHCATIQAAGGRIVYNKEAIPGVGWYAVVADPEGNAFGIFQPDPGAV